MKGNKICAELGIESQTFCFPSEVSITTQVISVQPDTRALTILVSG